MEHPEGAETGYRWYAERGKAAVPVRLRAYTQFGYAGLALEGPTVTASFQ